MDEFITTTLVNMDEQQITIEEFGKNHDGELFVTLAINEDGEKINFCAIELKQLIEKLQSCLARME